MTACDVYIGDLEDPSFNWDGGDVGGNIPNSISPIFPHVWGHYSSKFHEWVDNTGVVSKKTDFAGWVAIVRKSQIEDFLMYAYGSDNRYTDPVSGVVKDDQLKILQQFVDGLDPGRDYALVAAEW